MFDLKPFSCSCILQNYPSRFADSLKDGRKVYENNFIQFAVGTSEQEKTNRRVTITINASKLRAFPVGVAPSVGHFICSPTLDNIVILISPAVK